MQSTCGTSIYIPVDENIEEDIGRFRRATIGGIFEIREKNGTVYTVGMTVAHAFESFNSDAVVSESSESSDDSQFDFEFADAAPDGYSSDDGSRDQSPPSLSIQTMDRSNTTTYEREPLLLPNEVSTQKFTVDRYSDLQEFGVLHGISIKSSSNLDWALIRITKRGVTTLNTMRSSPMIVTPSLENPKDINEVEVVTCTGSRGAAGGIMCPSSTFMKAERSTTFEEGWTVQLNGTVAYGDSGSWIVDRASGTILGHIVAGDPSSGLVFIIPKTYTIPDIESQLECTIETPSKVEITYGELEGDVVPLVVSTRPMSLPRASYNKLSEPSPWSIDVCIGSFAENMSYNGSPAPTEYTPAASHAYHTRYNTGNTQTAITSTGSLSINETSQAGYQGNFSSLIRTIEYRPLEVTQSEYPRYLVIDGDSTPSQYSLHAAPTSTSAYDKGCNYVQTVYETPEASEQTTAETLNENTNPPSPAIVRWASEYEPHEAMAFGLSPSLNKIIHQHRTEGNATGGRLSSSSSATSSRHRKRSGSELGSTNNKRREK